MQISTVQQFAEACRGLDNDGIYDLFEDVISDDLRDEIYKISDVFDTPEPARLAFNLLGAQYNIESLMNY